MASLSDLQKRVLAFRDARNWKQFHNPKDIAIAINLEASEVLEHFLWKSEEETASHIKKHRSKVEDELIDVLYYNLLMADALGMDIESAFERKMAENETKYDVSKSKGSNKKYTDL